MKSVINKSMTGVLPQVVLALLLMTGELKGQDVLTKGPDTLRGPQAGMYPLPVLFYTPETGLAGGAAVLYLYRDSSAWRASNLSADIVYTEKRQFLAEVDGDQYFDGGRLRLVSYLSFQRFPNKFFGVGNNTLESDEETYTPQTFLLHAVLYRNIYSSFNIGPMVQFENSSMREVAPGGMLAAGTLPGSRGGTIAGLGIVANWDSRDNTFAARSGSFCQVTTMFYRSAFGSDYGYEDVQVDARKFFTLFTDHVIGVQGFGEFLHGTPPFQAFAKFGGPNLLRGYFEGEYRDRNALALQAEYRMPLWWRFGVVGFAGVAQVSGGIGKLALDRFWFAGGVGVRFAWNPEERINLRLDFGMGKNSSGMYIRIAEAF